MPGTPSRASSELVAEAERLLFTAALEGRLDLCRLTDDEQTLLGGLSWALGDADVAVSWSQLSEADRQARLVAARRALLARGEASISEGDVATDVLTPGPALGLVLAARARPTYVVLAGGTERSALLGPRLYALVDEAVGLRGLVVELTVDSIHDYRLLTPEHAARSLTQWARRALTTSDLGEQVRGLGVEILRHRDGEPMTMAGVVITEVGGALTVARRDFDGSRDRSIALSDEEVELLLLDLLERAAFAPDAGTGVPA